MENKNIQFTGSEKTAVIVCHVLSAIYLIAYIVLMISGHFSGMAVIAFVTSLIFYGIFMLCIFYPQHTNLVGKPEECTDERLHSIRRGAISACFIVPAVIFAMALILGI